MNEVTTEGNRRKRQTQDPVLKMTTWNISAINRVISAKVQRTVSWRRRRICFQQHIVCTTNSRTTWQQHCCIPTGHVVRSTVISRALTLDYSSQSGRHQLLHTDQWRRPLCGTQLRVKKNTSLYNSHISVFWYLTPCNLTHGCQTFVVKYSFRILTVKVGSVRSAGNHLPDYEGCPESIRPCWISREQVGWPWCNLAASQTKPYCSPVGLVGRQWDAVDWACVLCDRRTHNDRASRSASSRQRASLFYSLCVGFFGKSSHHSGLS